MTINASIDLRDLVVRMATLSRRGRTEATVQSDIRILLIASELNLTEDDVLEVELEAQLGDRRRIDIEMGSTVIEVKKTLASENALVDAVEQLTGYIVHRSHATGQRYTGVVTDGAAWHVFHLASDTLREVASYNVDPSSPDPTGLTEWLGALLATEERVSPTAAAISNRLGATSPGHALEQANLRAIYEQHRDDPTVTIKRELWARLLTTALGTQFHADDDSLFVEHTLLVATAECIAHAALGWNITEIAPASLLGGDLFSQRSQIHGVVEQDFFDWPLECGPAGRQWVAALARRLSQFDWAAVDHDVMKTIYESVITVETRKRLGEYYTPDFLAEAVIEATVLDPLKQRILDPACGSGTFLFHCVRRFLAAAEAKAMPTVDTLNLLVDRVAGIDVHPVAVTLARVTYLLAIGQKYLRSPERPALRIPVYLGDSVQWGQRQDLFSSESLNVATNDGVQLFADELRFPDRLLGDADRFDSLVAEMSEAASNRDRGSPFPSMQPIARRHALSGDDLETITKTFDTMCRLHDQGRDHIWGYYVRNLARPAWLARPENRLDVLVGNPPWLSYRFMTEGMKLVFRSMSEERGLWTGGNVASHQDLSDMFVVRTIEQYLVDGGSFGFIMPAGVLARKQSDGLRSGSWDTRSSGRVSAAFRPAWDLSPISPQFFPRTACAVFGQRSDSPSVMPVDAELWSGPIPDVSASWSEVKPHIHRTHFQVRVVHDEPVDESPYRSRFANGANIYPRAIMMVQEDDAPPVGTGQGRVAVRSDRGIYEKAPWKDLPDLKGVVEAQFIHPLLIGENILPFRQRSAGAAVLPLRNGSMLSESQMGDYDGLRRWWEESARLWRDLQKTKLTLTEHVDHYSKLTSQFPLAPHRVVYGASGMHVTACRVSDPSAVIEHQLYWAATQSEEESHYLCAILNSVAVTKAVEPLMVSGKGGGRHISSYLWRVPIPLFDHHNEMHLGLARLGRAAEDFLDNLELPNLKSHGALRKRVRGALAAQGMAAELDQAVYELLDLPEPLDPGGT